MKVRFTPAARAQFLEGLEHIQRDDPTAALRFREKAEHALRRFETLPASGRSIPEAPALPHRGVIVRPYRFFYRVVGKTVWIVAVWHGAQVPDGPKQLVRLVRACVPLSAPSRGGLECVRSPTSTHGAPE